MSTVADSSDVVVVGAGPTGLMAATLLRRAGVTVRILDKSAQQAHESRAFAVHAKSMELLASIGLADQFLERGLIASGAQIYVDGRRAAEIDFDDIPRSDTPFAFVLMVPQWEIEAILAEDLGRHGVSVEHGVEVTSLEQSAGGVVARATGPDGAFEVRGSYLIGADGAHSIVRKTLGLAFEGAPYPQGFLLADCTIDWPLDHDHLKIFVRGRNLAVFLPLHGREVGRIITIKPFAPPTTAAAAEAAGAEPASLDEVQDALRAASRCDVTLHDPVWVTGYRIHHRGVKRYSEGRVFIAGDAAHIHSPAGGQGMNTGLQDAANLAWKLALVLARRAPPALLESYHAERWPVGQKILQRTDRLFAVMSSQTGWVAGLRNGLLPLFAGTLARSSVVRARAFHFVSQLGIRYRPSPFIHDASPPSTPRAWRTGLSAGHRAPNGMIARGRDVFGLIDGYRFHLLALSRRPLAADEIATLATALTALAGSVSIDLATHLVAHSLVGRDPRMIQAESHQVFAVYGLTHEVPRALFLIRPDGYIAYRAVGLDVPSVQQFIAQRFTSMAAPRAD